MSELDPDTSDPTLAKAKADLSWERLVAAVAARCQGPLRERLVELPLASTLPDAQRALAEAREAWRLAEDGDPLPLDGAREIGRSLARLAKHGTLDGPELRAIASTLGAARALRRFLSRHRASCPALHEACSTDPTLDGLQEDLLRAIEPDGTLSDAASPDLGRLRGEVSALRGRIVARLEEMLLQHEDIVQDRFHTVREGRYVLPIRTDAHERLPGIVHATSGSGATLFLEPRAIVEQGNRLKMAEGELEREVQRILGILGEQVRERLPEVEHAVASLDRADLRSASARLTRDLKGVYPELSATPELVLVSARHPLLVLDGVDVVPNELELAEGRGLVLSGPNAGGKTVALKLLGLAALMVRAGLPLPAAEGSRAGLFTDVLTDVGDDQSLERNLSTFSAQVTHLARVIERAGSGSLVLLDEVATGTDPDEGAALAVALVTSLVSQGAAVAVTTHYRRLKALALSDARIRNASVGFDVERMEPTFHVRPDVIGSSSAFAVARRFGMPERVLSHAHLELPEQSRTFDALARKLEDQFDALEAEREAASRARREAEVLREEARAALDKIRARDQRALGEESARVMSQLRDARAELKEARAVLRRREDHDAASLAKVRDQIETTATTVTAIAPTPEAALPQRGAPVEESALAPGMRVWLPHLRTEVDVVEAPARGRLRVAAGPVKLWVRVDEVRSLDAARPASVEPRRADTAPARPPRAPDASNSVDVRGMRVDDAVSMVESFLDRMFGASEPVAYVVHGVGSGALRDAIRAHLGAHLSQYVREARAGTLEEGGERVTVVSLR